MVGVLISEDGVVTSIDVDDDELMRSVLGMNPSSIRSPKIDCELMLHELALRVVMPVNAMASMLLDRAVFGPVVAVAEEGSEVGSFLVSPTFGDEAATRCGDEALKQRIIGDFWVKNGDCRFVCVDGDRWLFNGKAFNGIVIAESSDHMEDGVPRFDVWLFGNDPQDPAVLKFVEHSMADVMAILLEADVETSKGSPPPQFVSIVHKLGI